VPAAATLCEAFPELAPYGGRCAPATPDGEGVLVATTPCGAISRLTHDDGRRAPASVHAWYAGVFQSIFDSSIIFSLSTITMHLLFLFIK
jgi:hypothetical protein